MRQCQAAVIYDAWSKVFNNVFNNNILLIEFDVQFPL